MKKGMLIIVSLFILTTGCKTDETRFVFEHVHIPSVIQDKAEQREYLSHHFWDSMPWNDSTININEKDLRQPYYEYLSVINGLGLSKAQDRLSELAEKTSNSSKDISESFLSLFEESLDHPNSPMRQEKLYISVIEVYIKNLDESNPAKNKLLWDRDLLIKNRIGDLAEDFQIVFYNGPVQSLHSILSDYTLIFFFEPDCSVCKESINYANNSQAINIFKDRYQIIAIYTGQDISSYEKVAHSFPAGWKVGQDLNNTITVKRLYDRRASPSVYILDKDKKVLMKDGDIKSAEELINIILTK